MIGILSGATSRLARMRQSSGPEKVQKGCWIAPYPYGRFRVVWEPERGMRG